MSGRRSSITATAGLWTVGPQGETIRCVHRAGASRQRMARSLNAAYAGGLLSEKTFVTRLDYLLRSRVVDSFLLLGALFFCRRGRSTAIVIKTLLGSAMSTLRRSEPSAVVLELNCSGVTPEYFISRRAACYSM